MLGLRCRLQSCFSDGNALDSAWQWLALIIPFCVWAILMLSPLSSGKTLANLGEPIYFSFAMPVLALIRVAVGGRMSERFHATAFLTALSGFAAGIFFTVPSLPE